MFASLSYLFKRYLTMLTGRGASSVTAGVVTSAGGFTANVIPFIALPLGGLVMGYIARMDFKHGENTLLDTYRDEIAAQLRKNSMSVTVKDMYAVAEGMPDAGIEGNPTLQEALDRNRRSQMFDIFSHAVATLVGIAAVGVLTVSLGWPALALGVAGLAITAVTDSVIDQIGKPLLGLSEPTVHDHVRAVQKSVGFGRSVSQEQVFGVFAAAHKNISAQIENYFQQSYDILHPQAQQQAMRMFGDALYIERLTNDINSRQVKPTELAFAAQGQQSGVPRLLAPPRKYTETAMHALQSGFAKGAISFQNARTYFSPRQTEQAMPEQDQRSWVDYTGGKKTSAAGYTQNEIDKRQVSAAAGAALSG